MALLTALRTVRRSSALGAEKDGPGTGAKFNTPFSTLTLFHAKYRVQSPGVSPGKFETQIARWSMRGLRPQKSQRLRGLMGRKIQKVSCLGMQMQPKHA